MAIIKKRRLAAHRFLKYYRLKATGREKILVFDIANLPRNANVSEFLKNWQYNQRYHIQTVNSL